jgi:hypothetical protein
VCQNVARSKGMVQGVLTHEMIHMFDYCRNALDFKNVDHLACTEVRAANLTHCSFMSAWRQGDASPFRVQRQHQVCDKQLCSVNAFPSVPYIFTAYIFCLDGLFVLQYLRFLQLCC